MIEEVFEQQWHWPPGSAFLIALQPGGAGDVEMRPGVFLGEAGKEAASGNGAGFGAADVGDVGKVALQLLLVLFPQRQAPAASEPARGCTKYPAHPWVFPPGESFG